MSKTKLSDPVDLSLYSYAVQRRRRVAQDFSVDAIDPYTGKKVGSPVRQEFAAEADIHNILKRTALNGGILPEVNRPQYGDFSSAPSYEEALNLVVQAEDAFYSLDAEIRDRFHNNPSVMLKFLDDPKNYDEAVKLGIVSRPVPKPEPEPQKVVIVNSEPQGGSKKD